MGRPRVFRDVLDARFHLPIFPSGSLNRQNTAAAGITLPADRACCSVRGPREVEDRRIRGLRLRERRVRGHWRHLVPLGV